VANGRYPVEAELPEQWQQDLLDQLVLAAAVEVGSKAASLLLLSAGRGRWGLAARTVTALVPMWRM